MAVGDGRVGQAGRSENCCRHFKLILCCFLSIISPRTKFRPNWMKNAEVENFHYQSGLVGRAGRSNKGRRHFKIILCCFWAIFSPHTKFHTNRMKNSFGWSGWQVEKCSQAYQTHFMLFLLHYQPPRQISSKSDRNQRS